MNEALLQVIYTYTTRRWMMWGALGGGVLVALFLFGASQMSATPSPMLVGQLIALPIMVGMIVLATHAKWQFVHWRSRLYPGYAAPHLAVILAVIAALLVAYPLVSSPLLRASPLGLVAFALLFGATVVWQMQTLRAFHSFLMLGLLFSFYIPSTAKLWVAEGSAYAPLRSAAIVVGIVGLGAWLARLTHMTEEDNDYFLLVQPSGANASRVEKSEARRTIARTLTRNTLTARATDWWHNRLARMPAYSEQARWRLLRYGTMSIPAPLVAVNFLAMMCLIVGMQYLTVTSLIRETSSSTFPVTIAAQLGMAILIVLPVYSQFLSMRRSRFAQDLMLPMSRESYVDGLFRSVIEAGLWCMVPMLVIVVGAMASMAPQYLTWKLAIAALVTIAALVPLSAAVSLRMVLVRSGMTRGMVLVALMYPLVGATIGLFAVTAYVNVVLGLVLGGLLAGVGYAACRWARRVWLEAELGCL